VGIVSSFVSRVCPGVVPGYISNRRASRRRRARRRGKSAHANGRFRDGGVVGFQNISVSPTANGGPHGTTKARDLDGEFASWKRAFA
jgi:hypothetical protein